VLPCWIGAFVVAAILCSGAQHWRAAPPQSLSLLTSPIATCRTLVCSEVAGVTAMAKEAHNYSLLLKRAWERLDILLEGAPEGVHKVATDKTDSAGAQ
jgi:hypothetical protein